MSDTPILRVENLSKAYGDLEGLRSVSLDVSKGETKAFIRPSRTGKSTLLRCINQLTVPDDGHVYLNGEEITHSGSKISEYRQKMGMVFQNFNLFDHLTAVRNAEIALLKVKKVDKSAARKKAMIELERVGMADRAIRDNGFSERNLGTHSRRDSVLVGYSPARTLGRPYRYASTGGAYRTVRLPSRFSGCGCSRVRSAPCPLGSTAVCDLFP
ncbi:MAG: ATP-binding cassette domain-containing protein [Methanocorpusculum sp.]|nr:ATP-binding cassette domain-containing protein [Methanocorpusculum sp.]